MLTNVTDFHRQKFNPDKSHFVISWCTESPGSVYTRRRRDCQLLALIPVLYRLVKSPRTHEVVPGDTIHWHWNTRGHHIATGSKLSPSLKLCSLTANNTHTSHTTALEVLPHAPSYPFRLASVSLRSFFVCPLTHMPHLLTYPPRFQQHLASIDSLLRADNLLDMDKVYDHDNKDIVVIKAPLAKLLRNPRHLEIYHEIIKTVNRTVTASHLLAWFIFIHAYEDDDQFIHYAPVFHGMPACFAN